MLFRRLSDDKLQSRIITLLDEALAKISSGLSDTIPEDIALTEAGLAMVFLAEYALTYKKRTSLLSRISHDLLDHMEDKGIGDDYLPVFFLDDLVFLADLYRDRINAYAAIANKQIVPYGRWFFGSRQDRFDFHLLMLLGDYIFYPVILGEAYMGDYSVFPTIPSDPETNISFALDLSSTIFPECIDYFHSVLSLL